MGAFLKKRNQDPDIIHKLGSILKRSHYTVVMENILESPIGWGGTLYKIVGDDYIRGMKAAAPLTAREFNMTTDEYLQTLTELGTRFAKAKTFIHIYICLAQKPYN